MAGLMGPGSSPMGMGLTQSPMGLGDPLAAPPLDIQSLLQPDPYANDERLLAIFDQFKRESTEYRWIWEREWLRDLFYVANRQWITFHPTRREWIDKRLQKWVPRPVTNKMAEITQAIRTNFAAINLAIKARPVNNSASSIAAADIADQLAPLLHEEHRMQQVMREADFWLITTGNAILQISWDRDPRFNKTFVPNEKCLQCGQTFPPKAIVDAGNKCPACGSMFLQPATDELGKPMGADISFGRGKTSALSPFEYAFAPNVTNFDDLPYIIRLRWRDKHWVEANAPDLVGRISWEKSPSDRSMQIFKSLALTNDIGTGSQYAYLGAAGSHTVEGVTEYELWMKPTPEFPEGLVMRVWGDQGPVLVRLPDEGLPGPFPYKDIQNNVIFPFVHAQYEHMGGRLYGRSALSPLIQKQDQLNQLDSLIQLCVQRTANPVWIIPENAGIENLTGEPGLIVKWNTLAANGQGKPERVEGADIPQSLFVYRAQILKDLEDLSGAFDIIKGQKPTGVEAFSALQLLVERSQSRFTAAFQSRGEMYRSWCKIALELERQFGPQDRTWAVVEPNRGYTFKHFQHANLQGEVELVIEDGSNMPKTALGKRAAIEQANQLQLLNPQEPDQKYALLQNFGLTDLVPSLDIHVQAAQQLHDSFEKWVERPEGPCPLVYKPWFDPQIHYNEHMKWLNSDKMKEILTKYPELEQLVTQILFQLYTILNPAPAGASLDGNHQGPPGGGPPPPTGAPGGGQAMANSNRESGNPGDVPSGNEPGGPQMGPV